jgi:hypothetical protein
MVYEQPSIFILGIRIDEPITTLTDLFVSAVCFYAYFAITKHRETSKLNNYLRFYFLMMGTATTIGGIIGHAFLYALPFNELLEVSPWKLPGWLVSMFAIALVERASIEYARPLIKSNTGKIFAWINIIELITFVIITFSTLNFFFVEVHSAYGLLVVVTGFQGYVFFKTKSIASKRMLIAVAFSAVGALFFMNEWGLSKWFNHYDISHMFMTASAYFFYLGAMKIEPLKVNV